jgi:hypothetical protein
VSRPADLERLRRELQTILDALEADLEVEAPGLTRRERRERARSALLGLVDDAIRAVTQD